MRIESTLARWAGFAILALSLTPSLARAQAAAGSGRIAYIDVRSIIQQAPDYPKAESTFTKEMQSLQKGVEKLQQQFDSTMSEYNKSAVVLSPSARSAKEKQLQTLQQTLQQQAGDLQTKAQERERELMSPIEQRIKGIIEGVRAERNIAVIFDISSQPNPIVAADRTLDITSTVLQRMKSAGQ